MIHKTSKTYVLRTNPLPSQRWVPPLDPRPKISGFLFEFLFPHPPFFRELSFQWHHFFSRRMLHLSFTPQRVLYEILSQSPDVQTIFICLEAVPRFALHCIPSTGRIWVPYIHVADPRCWCYAEHVFIYYIPRDALHSLWFHETNPYHCPVISLLTLERLSSKHCLPTRFSFVT